MTRLAVGCPSAMGRDDRRAAGLGQVPGRVRFASAAEKDTGVGGGSRASATRGCGWFTSRRRLRATAAGLARGRRRRARRSGPLTRPWREHPVGGYRRTNGPVGARAGWRPPPAMAGTRPPIPAPRRGRGSGGWPPGAGFPHGAGVALPAGLSRRRGPRPCRRR